MWFGELDTQRKNIQTQHVYSKLRQQLNLEHTDTKEKKPVNMWSTEEHDTTSQTPVLRSENTNEKRESEQEDPNDMNQ